MKKLTIILIIAIYLAGNAVLGQSVAITDDNGYTADPSAMLDVKSTSKGMLIPRVTTAQRTAISSPATGLLVFDTDLASFFFYDGVVWTNLSYGNASGIWSKTGNNIHSTNATDHIGVGTNAPYGKLEVKGDVSLSSNEPLFEVINSNGDTVFAVYSQGVHVRVGDDPLVKAGSSKGGFAVGGFSLSKGYTNEYMRVTPDSVRVYIEDGGQMKAGSSKGGFAVGGFSISKGLTNNLLEITDATTNVYIGDSLQGFGVTNFQSGTDDNLFDLTVANYFIGHETGMNTFGVHNTFFGYKAGRDNLGGFNNIFIGNKAGLQNTSGYTNLFLGNEAGYSNLGGDGNIFIGSNSGHMNTSGRYNVFIGQSSGEENISGFENVLIGMHSGSKNTASGNTFVGAFSGRYNTSGSLNTFIGNAAGNNNTQGIRNTALGCASGNANVINSDNVWIGAYAGLASTANDNTFVGSYSGRYNTTGAANTFIGQGAGQANTTSSNNVFVGYKAGFSYTAASGQNTFIGNLAGGGTTTGLKNVFIGYQAGYDENGNQKLYIDNSNTTTPLIYGDFSSDYVYINGSFKVTGTLYDDDGDPGASGQVLSSNGPGTDWITPAGDIAGVTAGNGLFGGGTTGTLSLDVGAGDGIDVVADAISVDVTDFLGAGLTESGNDILVYGLSASDGSPTNVVNVNNIGNVGINTTSQTSKLHVIDDAASNDDPAIYGVHAITDNWGVGVMGEGRFKGVVGSATTASGSPKGVEGTASMTGTLAYSAYGIYGNASGGTAGIRYGVYGTASGGGTAYAGYFNGNVHVNGTLSKSAGTFKIDHPQDPENKYLIHSFVESPDMKNVYDGTATLDNDGKTTIELPSYFEALNENFRYQLTTIGAFAPVFIEQEIVNNQFVIAGGNPGMKVSWQVTGVRKDPYALQHPIVVEEEKATIDKGKYLNPKEYNQPISKQLNGVDSVK